MKKRYKWIIIFFVIVFAVVGGYFLLINNGAIKNSYIKDLVIDVNVENNGDVRVKQNAMYRLNGIHNGITVAIPTSLSNDHYEKLTKNVKTLSNILSDNIYTSNGIENVQIYVINDGETKQIKQVEKAEIRRNGRIYSFI